MDFTQITNYLDEKFGAVIDWGSDKVLPQLQDLAHRVATIHIIGDISWIAISVILIVVAIFLSMRMYFIYQKYKKIPNEYNGFLFSVLHHSWGDDELELEAPGFCCLVVCGACLLIGLVALPIKISDLIHWIYVPEAELFEKVVNLMKGTA